MLLRHVILLSSFATLIAVFVIVPGPCSADDPVPQVAGARLAELLPALKKPPKDAQAPSVERVRARYEADRKTDAALAAWKAGEIDRAFGLAVEAEAGYRKADPDDQEKNYTFLFIFGIMELQRGRHDEAVASLRKAGEIADRAFGPESKQVADARTYQGVIEFLLRRNVEQGRPLLEDAVASYRKLGDLHDEDFLRSLQFLALTELPQKRIAQAIVYQREACDRWRDRNDAEGVERADALEVLGRYYCGVKDYAEARNRFEEAADLSEKRRGKEHAETKKLRDFVVRSESAFTESGESERLGKELERLEVEIRALKPPKDPRLSLKILQREAEILRLLNGEKDESTLEFLISIAGIHHELNELEAAAAEYRNILSILDRMPTDPTKERNKVLFNLASAEFQRERWDDARTYAAQSLAHASTVEIDLKAQELSHALLAQIEIRNKNYATALECVDRIYALQRRDKSERSRDAVEFRSHIAQLCSRDPALRNRCRTMLEDTRSAAKAELGQRDPDVARITMRLAMVQYRAQDAACIRTAAEAIDEGAELPAAELDSCRWGLAKYCAAFGELDRSKSLFEQELKTLRARPEPDVVHIATALRTLARLDAHQGRKTEAVKRYEEAIALCKDEAPQNAERYRKELEAFLAGKLPSLAPTDNPDFVAEDAAEKKSKN